VSLSNGNPWASFCAPARVRYDTGMNFLDVLLTLWRQRKAASAPSSLGERGEAEAERFLKKLGYKILARGSRNKLGELDLVALDKKTIAFVEVKTRRSTDAGHPADAVDTRKQAKLTRLALAFLKRHRLLNHAARFDVIAITWPDGREQPELEHFKNAFEATGHDSMFS
jgi:putative endonuclease